MHCLTPACVLNCPAAALRKSDLGPVIYDQPTCIGCKVCISACPFHIPRWNTYVHIPRWNEGGLGVSKCHFCFDRLLEGLLPACVEVCPAKALTYGDRDEIVEMAEARAEEVGGYVYGDDEAGGTSWIYVLPTAPGELGLPTPPPVDSATRALSTLAMFGGIGVIGGAVLGGILYPRKRATASPE